MKHRASTKFWKLYDQLPTHIQSLADKNFELLKSDQKHPSLHLKLIGKLWSARVGDHYRVLGIDDEPAGIYWIWIGTHAEYDQRVK